MNEIQLIVNEHLGQSRVNEIAIGSVPLPKGMARVTQRWLVRSPNGESAAYQVKPLALWPDDSIQWLSVAFPVTTSGGASAAYKLSLASGAEQQLQQTLPAIAVVESDACYSIDTGAACFELPKRGGRLIGDVCVGQMSVLNRSGVTSRLVDGRGQRRYIAVTSIEVVERGPLVAKLRWTGRIRKSGLLARGEWTFRAGSTCVSLDLTLHNPSRARHPRGCWDLGDPGSVLFRSFSLGLEVAGTEPGKVRYCEQFGAAEWTEHNEGQVEIEQLASGSSAGCSQDASTRGYVVRTSAGERSGNRASPAVSVQRGSMWAAAAIHEFWQLFPKSLQGTAEGLELGVFPEIDGILHELQGGEQKTTRLAFEFGDQTAPPEAPDMLSVLVPLQVRCDLSWMAKSQAIWRLPSRENLGQEWKSVAEYAVGGERGFFAKREAGNEYGWRNFGDLWADHEGAYYQGPAPIVSHYNNQYDALEGFLLAYLVTEDQRFWELADPLARHVTDIDIYHTTRDRAAYNGGQFWHTNHYLDAVSATHRAYSQVNHPQGGGGPSNEHNYSSGLLLYHYLTGNELAREAVISLAEWVLNMDDGRGHVLGLLDESPTGFASQTAERSYHGPGRGAGNSINTLLDGWLATRNPKFLHKADELVRRTIHPDDDIAGLNLSKAEVRWSYTVFLQSLLRFLALIEECDCSRALSAYIRACLLHYARWMVQHEVFYLDRPEHLEYPTETWAAQEIRKANILTAAAHLAEKVEAETFRAKADWFYDRAWTTLMGFPTWHYTRPLVLAIQLGLYAALFADAACLPEGRGGASAVTVAKRRGRFVPQREAVRCGARSPGRLLGMLARFSRVWRWGDHWRATWAAQRVRHLWRGILG